jgi:hypothetical protein
MTGGAGQCGFTVTAPIPGYDGESSPKVVFERRLALSFGRDSIGAYSVAVG